MKVSIIIPAFNAVESIGRCIGSVQRQDETDWECIVIDDASTDGTAALVAEMAGEDKRIRLLRNDTNRGVSFSRNRGLDAARGELISFLDSDDDLESDFLSYCLETMNRQGVDWVKSFLRAHRPDGSMADWGFTPASRKVRGRSFREAFADPKHDFGHVTGSLIRKSVLDGTRFTTGLSMGEDMLFSMELLCRNTPIYVSERRFYNYRRRIDGHSLSINGYKNKQDVILLMNSARRMLDRYAIPEEMHQRLLRYLDLSVQRHYRKDRTDIVICYVDGGDPQWQADYRRVALRTGVPSGEDGHFGARYANSGTLKYVLRSIERHFPDIHDKGGLIHLLVSSDSQVPDWMDRNRINIVRHKDVIPWKFLPIFNSSSIELFLHHIPGLAERFVYFNDDMFVFSAVREKDLFVDGKPRVRFIRSAIHPESKDAAWLHSFTNAFALGISPRAFRAKEVYFHPPHIALPMSKSACKACWDAHKSALLRSITPFRDRRNVNQYVFPAYGLVHGGYSPKMTVRDGYTNDAATDLIRKLDRMLAEGVQLACINGVADATDRNRQAVRKWLERQFPTPSIYEKEG